MRNGGAARQIRMRRFFMGSVAVGWIVSQEDELCM